MHLGGRRLESWQVSWRIGVDRKPYSTLNAASSNYAHQSVIRHALLPASPSPACSSKPASHGSRNVIGAPRRSHRRDCGDGSCAGVPRWAVLSTCAALGGLQLQLMAPIEFSDAISWLLYTLDTTLPAMCLRDVPAAAGLSPWIATNVSL